jgi:4-amino-4-deoxy-L-arabinose transferase-like glycosyltransferase
MPGAYLAAGLVMVAPALVVHSRFQTVDMLATMLAIASVYACIRLIEPEAPAMKWALLAGLFAGMSAGTKYVGIVAIVALIPACLSIKKPVLFAYAFLVAIAAFVITTPGCVLDTEKFVAGFMFELNHSKEGHGVVFRGTSPALIYHIGNLSSGASILTFLLGVGGLVYSLVKKNTWGIILAVFFVAYYVAVSGGQIKFMRYILPLIPVLALGVGLVVQKVMEAGKEKVGMAIAILVFGGVDRGSLVQTGGLTATMLGPDTRDVAGKWLRDKGEITVGLANDPWYWSPSIQPEVGMTRMFGQQRLLEMWSGWTKPKVSLYIPPNPGDRFGWDARLLTELKPEYVSASSFEYVPYKRLSEQQSTDSFDKLFGDRYREFKAVLDKEYEVVFITDVNHHEMVEDMEYVRPNVLIWQRKKTSANP